MHLKKKTMLWTLGYLGIDILLIKKSNWLFLYRLQMGKITINFKRKLDINININKWMYTYLCDIIAVDK